MLLSVQLFTVRDAMQADPVGTLRRLRSIGLDRVELAGTYGLAVRDFRAMLDDAGLLVSGSHLGIDRFENDLQSVVDEHRDLGCDRVILPWIGEEVYAAGPEALARRLGAIAQGCEANGLEFAYHNHAFELEQGWLGTMFGTAPANVRAQLDLGWIYAAGEDPVHWLQMLAGRVPTVHLKDMTDDPTNRDAVAGQGRLDWDAILPACQAAGVLVGVIEMDVPPGDPFDCVERCYQFFQSKIG